MFIRTKGPDPRYVHQIHGTAYISWVAEKNLEFARHFDEAGIQNLIPSLSRAAGEELEAVYPWDAKGKWMRGVRNLPSGWYWCRRPGIGLPFIVKVKEKDKLTDSYEWWGPLLPPEE